MSSLGAFLVITIFGVLTLSSTYSINNLYTEDSEGFFGNMVKWTMTIYLMTLGEFNTDNMTGMS
jgi:hypothetical protein